MTAKTSKKAEKSTPKADRSKGGASAQPRMAKTEAERAKALTPPAKMTKAEKAAKLAEVDAILDEVEAGVAKLEQKAAKRKAKVETVHAGGGIMVDVVETPAKKGSKKAELKTIEQAVAARKAQERPDPLKLIPNSSGFKSLADWLVEVTRVTGDHPAATAKADPYLLRGAVEKAKLTREIIKEATKRSHEAAQEWAKKETEAGRLTTIQDSTEWMKVFVELFPADDSKLKALVEAEQAKSNGKAAKKGPKPIIHGGLEWEVDNNCQLNPKSICRMSNGVVHRIRRYNDNFALFINGHKYAGGSIQTCAEHSAIMGKADGEPKQPFFPKTPTAPAATSAPKASKGSGKPVKKAESSNGLGVIGTIKAILGKASKKSPMSKDALLDALCKEFPGRERSALKGTVNCQTLASRNPGVRKNEKGFWQE